MLFILITLFILFASGGNLGTEATGYFNVILLADMLLSLIFLLLFKADKRLREKQTSS